MINRKISSFKYARCSVRQTPKRLFSDLTDQINKIHSSTELNNNPKFIFDNSQNVPVESIFTSSDNLFWVHSFTDTQLNCLDMNFLSHHTPIAISHNSNYQLSVNFEKLKEFMVGN